MSKHGAVLLGQVRLFMCRSGVQSIRPIELSGLRLTPVTAQRFAALQLRQAQHRSFATSSSSSSLTSDGEGGKKQDEHKTQTSPANEDKKVSSSDKGIKQKANIKFRWKRTDDKIPEKSFTSDNIPGFNVARRAMNFKRALIHKQMVDNYQAYRRKMNKPRSAGIGKEVDSVVKDELAKEKEKEKEKKVDIKDRNGNEQKPKDKAKAEQELPVDFGRLNLSDLRARLRARGLSVTGRKKTLIERLETTTTTAATAAEATTATAAATEASTTASTTATSIAATSSNLSPSRPRRAQQQQQQQLVNYTASSTSASVPQNADVSLEYVNGMPHLTIRLPSRNELCQFALKPISHTVGHLLAMLREEDRGIDRAAIINKHGVRIASSCTIERLLDDEFCIQINNRTLQVQPPEREKITVETIDKMGDVRKIIGQLYEAFNVGEYQLEKSNQLAKELETLRYELEPLEEKKLELAKKAERRTNMMTWVGLGLMSVQFGILARLTWWEYSWDIMEPVTYFVTYGTTMAMYAYYCVTKREYIMENVYNREYSLNIYRNAKKSQFDVEHYNRLKRRTAELEYNLSRLNDPINMNLPAHLVRTQLTMPPIDEFNNSDKSKTDKTT